MSMRPPLALVIFTALLGAPTPAAAQGLNVDVGVGDVEVGLSVGDDSTAGLSVGSGDAVGTGVGVETGGGGDPVSSPSGSGAGSEQEAALDAVRSSRALPLGTILELAGGHTDGEVIDARLIEVRGFLLYELKIIEPGGDVADLYFYARSGEIVRAE